MKRSEGKVKELKEKWRKWRKGDKHWSSLENCEEKTGIDREKQRFWPKLNELFASRSTGKPSSTHGATTSTTVPPDHLPIHCLQLNSTGNNWLRAHYHQSNRSGPLSSGLMGLRDLDKAGSAQGRRKEHPELPGSHSLVPAGTGYRDNTPHLAAGDACHVQGCKRTEETGKADRCLKKNHKKASRHQKNLIHY